MNRLNFTDLKLPDNKGDIVLKYVGVYQEGETYPGYSISEQLTLEEGLGMLKREEQRPDLQLYFVPDTDKSNIFPAPFEPKWWTPSRTIAEKLRQDLINDSIKFHEGCIKQLKELKDESILGITTNN